MLKRFIALCLASLLNNPEGIAQQAVELSIAGTLPNSCRETSGLELSIPGRFWTMNDSGNSADIYQIDSVGNVTKTISVNNASNVDWEDLARSQDGRLFIGDFGNNANDRTDLKIYILPNPDLVSGNTITPIGTIQFNYPDQSLFPPASDAMNFDCESMFWWNNHLYLISKNRGTSQYAKLYELPDQPGTCTATLLDSFNTGFWITGADISPNNDKLFLESYQGFWIFSSISNNQFFQGIPHQFSTTFSQKEGVVFSSQNTVYLTDEYLSVNQTGRNLYKLNLDTLLGNLTSINEVNSGISCVFNSENKEVILSKTAGLKRNNFPTKLNILDESGNNVYTKDLPKNWNTIQIPIDKNGLYIVHLAGENYSYQKKLIAF